MSKFGSYNPHTGARIEMDLGADENDVLCMMEAARDDACHWQKRTPQERLRALTALHDSIAAEAENLAHCIAGEVGKPLQEAYGADILPSLASLRWLAKHACRLLAPQRLKNGAIQTAEPYGVVGVIGTWNYPLYLNIAPIAWALAAGNVVVWKPSEHAVGVALRLKRLFEQAKLPVRVAFGDGRTGSLLCKAGCDKITFTGGAQTGRTILAELAKSGTPGVMELSGCDAMLLCEDAPIALAARSAVWGRCSNAGQSCVAPQRIFVARQGYEPFLAECRSALAALRPGIDYGPMRTGALREQAHRFVWDAMAKGARLLVGGHALPDCPGFAYMPTLIADCSPGMLVMEQDFFGPVLSVCPVADDLEAAARANDCRMALGASVWTADAQRGAKIAARLAVGMVSINDVLLDAAEPGLPFGGLRGSGFGKQRGAAGLEEFVVRKVTVAHAVKGARRHLFPYRAETLPILRGLAALQAARGASAKWKALRALTQAAMQWERSDRESKPGPISPDGRASGD